MKRILFLMMLVLFTNDGNSQVPGAVNNNMSSGWREMSGLGNTPNFSFPEGSNYYASPPIFDTNGRMGLCAYGRCFVFDSIICYSCSDHIDKNVYIVSDKNKIGLLSLNKNSWMWSGNIRVISPAFDEIIYTASLEPNPYFWSYFVVRSGNKYGICDWDYVWENTTSDQILGEMILECEFDKVIVIEKKYTSSYLFYAWKDDIMYKYSYKGTGHEVKQIEPKPGK